MAVDVHPANVQDRDGAKPLLEKVGDGFPRLTKIWADGGYAGKLVDWVLTTLCWTLEIVKRQEKHNFEVLPRRWVVERTFAWLNRYRRLSKDYETLTDSSETVAKIAMINLMVHRLRPG